MNAIGLGFNSYGFVFVLNKVGCMNYFLIYMSGSEFGK